MTKVKLSKLAKKKSASKPASKPSERPAFRQTPFETAISRLMRQREIISKRTALVNSMRASDAEMRQKAAEQTLAGYRQLGWMP